jgi:hypothetical protein
MVTDIVQTAISSLDGAAFTTLDSCPFCGGPVQGYDSRKKKYAVLHDGTGERTITVLVKRFTCRNCNRLSNADEPFYPNTRIGSLIVDLFFTFASTMPESRAARHLEAMGIRVDRTTWKNYAVRPMPKIPATDIFGMRLPSSVLTLSALMVHVPEGGAVAGAEALAACGFPSTFLGGAGDGEYNVKAADLHTAENQLEPVSLPARSREPAPTPTATSTIRF